MKNSFIRLRTKAEISSLFHLSSLGGLHLHHHPSATAGGLGVLTTNLEAPEVTETTMVTASFHAFQILTELLIEDIGVSVHGLTVLPVTLSVQHVGRDLKLQWVSQDGDDLIDLVHIELTSALVEGDIALL